MRAYFQGRVHGTWEMAIKSRSRFQSQRGVEQRRRTSHRISWARSLLRAEETAFPQYVGLASGGLDETCGHARHTPCPGGETGLSHKVGSKTFELCGDFIMQLSVEFSFPLASLQDDRYIEVCYGKFQDQTLLLAGDSPHPAGGYTTGSYDNSCDIAKHRLRLSALPASLWRCCDCHEARQYKA